MKLLALIFPAFVFSSVQKTGKNRFGDEKIENNLMLFKNKEYFLVLITKNICCFYISKNRK